MAELCDKIKKLKELREKLSRIVDDTAESKEYLEGIDDLIKAYDDGIEFGLDDINALDDILDMAENIIALLGKGKG